MMGKIWCHLFVPLLSLLLLHHSCEGHNCLASDLTNQHLYNSKMDRESLGEHVETAAARLKMAEELVDEIGNLETLYKELLPMEDADQKNFDKLVNEDKDKHASVVFEEVLKLRHNVIYHDSKNIDAILEEMEKKVDRVSWYNGDKLIRLKKRVQGYRQATTFRAELQPLLIVQMSDTVLEIAEELDERCRKYLNQVTETLHYIKHVVDAVNGNPHKLQKTRNSSTVSDERRRVSLNKSVLRTYLNNYKSAKFRNVLGSIRHLASQMEQQGASEAPKDLVEVREDLQVLGKSLGEYVAEVTQRLLNFAPTVEAAVGGTKV